MKTERKGIILFSSLLWGQHHLSQLTLGLPWPDRAGQGTCLGAMAHIQEHLKYCSLKTVGILDPNTPDLHALAGHSGRCVLYGYSSHNAIRKTYEPYKTLQNIFRILPLHTTSADTTLPHLFLPRGL